MPNLVVLAAVSPFSIIIPLTKGCELANVAVYNHAFGRFGEEDTWWSDEKLVFIKTLFN